MSGRRHQDRGLELEQDNGSQAVYRFPKKSYGNVEGIAWLSEDTLVCVSDKKKKRQPEKCAAKDQSIHIFRIPSR